MKSKKEEPEQVARNQTREGSEEYLNSLLAPVAKISRQLEQLDRIQDDDQDSDDKDDEANKQVVDKDTNVNILLVGPVNDDNFVNVVANDDNDHGVNDDVTFHNRSHQR